MKLANNEINFLRAKLRLARINQRDGMEPFHTSAAQRVHDLTRRLGLAKSAEQARRMKDYLPGSVL